MLAWRARPSAGRSHPLKRAPREADEPASDFMLFAGSGTMLSSLMYIMAQ